MIPGVPYDEELEYIESTGTQWIDTGVIGKPDTGADISFRWVGNQSGDAVILGCRNNSISAPRFVMLMTNQTKIRQLGVGDNWFQTGYYVMDVDYRSVSSFTSSLTTQELDGITIISATNAIADTGLNLALFGNNVNGNTINIPKARVYQAKIYSNNTLVRDLIPVRVNGVAKMYDRVTRTFPAHYGTFVAGPVVARPVMGLHFYPRVYTARDYIQDGLIAMWDGIENAGWGTHDASATVWKDLVGINDLTLAQSSSLYFAETYLYASNTQYAEGDISKIPANLNNVTYEVCWNRVSKFDKAADSNNCYGQMVLDVFENKLWYKCSQQNGGYMNTPPSDAIQGVPFTQSMICQYSGSADTIIPFVNGTQISNTILYSSNPQINRVRIGSGWQDPASRHHCIRIYNRALTASEIAHNYNIDKWRFNLP